MNPNATGLWIFFALIGVIVAYFVAAPIWLGAAFGAVIAVGITLVASLR